LLALRTVGYPISATLSFITLYMLAIVAEVPLMMGAVALIRRTRDAYGALKSS